MKKPTLFGTAVVLLAIVALYTLGGSLLAQLACGSGPAGDPCGLLSGRTDSGMLSRIRASQAAGQLLLLGMPVFWLARRHSGAVTPFDRANRSWLGMGEAVRIGRVLAASAGMLCLQPLMYSIVELQNLLLPMFGQAGEALLREQDRVDAVIRQIGAIRSAPEFLAVAAVLVLTPAICEELLFRAYVQKCFSMLMPPKTALLLSGLAFALFHFQLSNIVPLALLGWYIGYIYMESGDFAVPAAAHATNNLAALLLLQSGGASGAGAPSVIASWQWWFFVSASFVLFLMLMSRFFRPAVCAQHR